LPKQRQAIIKDVSATTTSELEDKIFEKGSTTFFSSAQLFPKGLRDDVTRLYSFVRVADDYVDTPDKDHTAFDAFCKAWDVAKDDPHLDLMRRSTDTIDERVIKNMAYLERTYALDPAWIEAFLSSMYADIEGTTYRTLDDTLGYVYGSAEVIGLIMACVMGLPEEAWAYARLQGRAMQYINFIRDIDEDCKLGRCYFARTDLDLFRLKDLTAKTARANKQLFRDFMAMQLGHYHDWQTQAREGFKYLPKEFRRGLEAAIAAYDWTAEVIAKDPLVVYERQVKPTKKQLEAFRSK